MKNGFTLVELAIVLMIIGLLIGGILRAQEVIQNAQTKRFMVDEKVIAGAYNTYFDKYGSLPGDDPRTLARFPDCSSFGLCNNGNGNNQIEEATESALVALVAARMIRGDRMGAPKGYNNCMASPVRNAFWNIHTPQGLSLFGQQNYAWLNLIDATDGGVFTPIELKRIDEKLDDGNGTSGMLLGINSNGGGNCTNPPGYNGAGPGSGDYDLNEKVKSCRPFFRL